ncbi:extracellular solute-binding protein [Bacillus fonticola]|uniref:extracellular solute-binding protein n=1 Tax=Bacillus fonticola TaxID=2728853 RepID=UPI00147354A2|nr:extracellular solute-binding protein [Bacillus fonticola]
MKKKWGVLLASIMILLLSACSGNNNEAAGDGDEIVLEYWQYFYESKVDLMDELIKEFEAANPGIKIDQTTFPYDSYNEKVATLVPAGKGPDIINLYYGWVPKYVDSGYLQPLSQDVFPQEQIEKDFFPFIDSVKLDDEYWVLPTAVRTLALFYNKDLFAEAGLTEPPKTWDELVDYSVALTERDSNGQLVTAGMAWELGGQLHNWFRDALIYQAGGEGLSEDRKTLLWDDTGAGLEAFTYLVEFATKYKVGEKGFYQNDVTAFKTGNAAMNVDGSFRLGTLATDTPDLNYGVAPLPSYKEEATQSSFWANGITSKVEGEKLDAANKFLEFLTSKDVMERWLEEVGELPAKEEVAFQDKYLTDEKIGPFIEQLPNANAHFFVDETLERDYVIQATDKVVLGEATIEEAYDELVQKTQALYDEYWSNRK